MNDFFSYSGNPDTAAQPASATTAPRAILAELSGEDWEKFIGYTARRRYPAGATVHAIGDAAPALCFVASGQVELRGATPPPAPEAARRGLLGRAAAKPPATAPRADIRGEGAVFGMLSFLDGAPSAVSAQVGSAGPAELLFLSPEALQQLAAWQPRIALMLMRDLGAHVAARLRGLQPAD